MLNVSETDTVLGTQRYDDAIRKGEITVDGPDAPSDTGIPTLPGSQWGVTQQPPYSHDVGPLGP
jgi:hypothetical protein